MTIDRFFAVTFAALGGMLLVFMLMLLAGR